MLATPYHLPFAVRLDPMRIDGQQLRLKMAKRAADFPQRNLQPLRFENKGRILIINYSYKTVNN